MTYTVSQLHNLVATKITSGGRLVTAVKAREVFDAIVDSYSNLIDGGNIFQAEVGYSYLPTLTDNKSFTHKKYVDDLVSSAVINPYTFNNGLTNTLNIIQLGGALNQNTNITGGASYDFNLGTFASKINNFGLFSFSSNQINFNDGSSVGNFVQNGGGTELSHTQGSDSSALLLTPQSMQVFSIYSGFKGLEEYADFSANYSSLSLINKGYAISQFLKFSGGTMTGNILFSGGFGIDTTATAGTDTLNIGGTNAEVINIGNAGSIVNILGTALFEYAGNQYVLDKLITLNYNGALASGAGVGFEIEENSVITGYLKTNAARNGFSFRPPAVSFFADINLNLLSANRAYSLPDVSGNIVTTGDSGTVTGAMIAASVALSGSPTTTTQAQGDNSTKIATTAYVDAALTSVIAEADLATQIYHLYLTNR